MNRWRALSLYFSTDGGAEARHAETLASRLHPSAQTMRLPAA